MNLRRTSKGRGESFSIQKFMLQILDLYIGLFSNTIFRKWGGWFNGRLEFFSKIYRLQLTQTERGIPIVLLHRPIFQSIFLWVQRTKGANAKKSDPPKSPRNLTSLRNPSECKGRDRKWFPCSKCSHPSDASDASDASDSHAALQQL